MWLLFLLVLLLLMSILLRFFAPFLTLSLVSKYKIDERLWPWKNANNVKKGMHCYFKQNF